MNKFLKILSLVFLLTLNGCEDKKKTGLVVGTSADYPPFSFTKGKQIVGFDIDLAKIIADKLGYKLHIKDMNFSKLVPALKQNKIDFAIAAITATSKRSREIDFSAVKYYLPKLSLIYRKGNPITSIKALENRTIAVQTSSTMESFVRERLNIIKNVRIVSFERTALMLEDLKKGRIDCILIGLAEAEIFCFKDKTLGYSLLRSPSNVFNYAIALPKGSVLASEIDNVMLKLKVSSELDRLKTKWLNSNLSYYKKN